MDRLDWNTIKNVDSLSLKANTVRKIYLRSENYFNYLFAKAGDTVLINITDKKIDFNFKNRDVRILDTINYIQSIPKPILEISKKAKSIKKELSKSNKKNIQISALDYFDLQSKYINQITHWLKDMSSQEYISAPNSTSIISALHLNTLQDLSNIYLTTNDDKAIDIIRDNYLKNTNLLNDDTVNYAYLNTIIKQIVLKGKYTKGKTKIIFDYKRAFDFYQILCQMKH